MALKKFTWANGTQESPIALSTDELNVLIPSNPSVRYNFIYFSFEVSKAYLLIVVNNNDVDNVAGSTSDVGDDLSLSFVESLFSDFDSSQVTSMEHMFGSSNIQSIDMRNLNTDKLQNLKQFITINNYKYKPT